MLNENTGIVFTNDNCIGCNRCISGCPIPEANIAHYENGVNRIMVDSKKCIHCGHCISVCQHDAREYIDNTDCFFADLAKGKSISLAIAPSFYTNYGDNAYKVLGFLKSLGVKKIYNVSFGADISTWAHVKYLTENPQRGGITQPCAASINFLEHKTPHILSCLFPIHSPLMCLAVYARKYLCDSNSIAFISPCIAKIDEIRSPDTHNLVQYNVTFAHLMKKLQGTDLSSYCAQPDIPDYGLGAAFPLPGGMKENLEHFLGYDRAIFKGSNLISVYPHANDFEELTNSSNKQPLIIEPLHCEHGCLFGSGTELSKASFRQILTQYQKTRVKVSNSADEQNPYSRTMPRPRRIELLNKRFKDLHFQDFYRTYQEKYEQPFEIPPEVYNTIFESMHKNTEKSRHVDCQSCGYNSCYAMAFAIANGLNTINNCVRYERDENYRLYTTDTTTGLPNKSVFSKTLNDMIQHGSYEGFSIIQFNIKNFMLINAHLGFSTGTKILREFADKMRSSMDPKDMVFSESGNTFNGIIKTEHINNFIFLINHLTLPTLENQNILDVQTLTVRCAVYHFDGTETDNDSICNRLNAAYFISKSQKNNDTVIYDKNASEKLVYDLLTAEQIPIAIENKDLFIVFQPKVNLSDYTLAGAEALIRWNRDGKIVPPDDFIPICESSGLIKRLDFYVLNQVCQHISQWMAKGLDIVKISVNFSKLHFSQDEISQRICNVIDTWKVPHELIEIEFTETSYNDMQETLQSTINILKKTGISSSIDDFGTGYSSLSLLQNLDFDILKLDKSLISSMLPNKRSRKVIANIINMARDLNMDVVAEGVETKEELSVLSKLNCNTIQGFIFDRPLSATDFENRLKSKKYTE